MHRIRKASSQHYSLFRLTPCTNEEADTRIILHLEDAVTEGFNKISIRTVDTDVVVLAVAAAQRHGNNEIWIAFGTGKSFCFLAAHEMARVLGPDQCTALLMFRAFTECDTVSFFGGRGKRTAWDTWRSYNNITSIFVSSKHLRDGEEFSCITGAICDYAVWSHQQPRRHQSGQETPLCAKRQVNRKTFHRRKQSSPGTAHQAGSLSGWLLLGTSNDSKPWSSMPWWMGLEKKGTMQLGSQLDLTARSNGGLQRTCEVWLQERLQRELQMLKGCSAVRSSMSMWWTMHWELGFFMVKQHWILWFLCFLLLAGFIHGSKDFLQRKSFFSISKVVTTVNSCDVSFVMRTQ